MKHTNTTNATTQSAQITASVKKVTDLSAELLSEIATISINESSLRPDLISTDPDQWAQYRLRVCRKGEKNAQLHWYDAHCADAERNLRKYANSLWKSDSSITKLELFRLAKNGDDWQRDDLMKVDRKSADADAKKPTTPKRTTKKSEPECVRDANSSVENVNLDNVVLDAPKPITNKSTKKTSASKTSTAKKRAQKEVGAVAPYGASPSETDRLANALTTFITKSDENMTAICAVIRESRAQINTLSEQIATLTAKVEAIEAKKSRKSSKKEVAAAPATETESK